MAVAAAEARAAEEAAGLTFVIARWPSGNDDVEIQYWAASMTGRLLW